MLQFDKSGDPLHDSNLLIELDENQQNFSNLRSQNRKNLHTSIKQEEAVNLAQNSQQAVNAGGTHVHIK